MVSQLWNSPPALLGSLRLIVSSLSSHFLRSFGHVSPFLHLPLPLQRPEFPPYLCLVLGPFRSYPTKLQKSGQVLGYQNSPFESATREFPDSYLILVGVSPALGLNACWQTLCQ